MQELHGVWVNFLLFERIAEILLDELVEHGVFALNLGQVRVEVNFLLLDALLMPAFLSRLVEAGLLDGGTAPNASLVIVVLSGVGHDGLGGLLASDGGVTLVVDLRRLLGGSRRRGIL